MYADVSCRENITGAHVEVRHDQANDRVAVDAHLAASIYLSFSAAEARLLASLLDQAADAADVLNERLSVGVGETVQP